MNRGERCTSRGGTGRRLALGFGLVCLMTAPLGALASSEATQAGGVCSPHPETQQAAFAPSLGSPADEFGRSEGVQTPDALNASDLDRALAHFRLARHKPADDEWTREPTRDYAYAVALLSRIDAAPGEPTLRFERRLHLARTLGDRGSAPETAPEIRSLAAQILAEVAEGAEGARVRLWANGELARIELAANRIEEALALSRRSFASAQAAGDQLAVYRFGRTLASALEKSGKRTASLELLRKTAALGDALRRDRLGRTNAAGRPLQGSAGAEWVDFQETTDHLLARLLDEVEGTEEGVPARRALLSEVRDLLETQRSAAIEDYFQDACLAPAEAEGAEPTLQGAATASVGGAVVLYPIWLPDRVGLLSDRGGRLSFVRSPAAPAVLGEQVEQFRRLLEKRTTRQYLRPATAIFDALIRPILPTLEVGDVDALVVVPDGALRTIPFAALYDGEAKRFLGDLVPVALVPSMRLTRPSAMGLDSVTVLAAGLGVSVGGFSSLDHTGAELAQIEERFATRVYFDQAFKVETLETEVRTRPYSIVHLATHGRVEQDGGESFLQTFDGRLGLNRMMSLIQTTRFRQERPLELLTLSACETAAGDERAALGLAGVAVRSGARSALATLWAVNDEATTRLIDRFYAELMKPGQTRAGALQVAQREIRSIPRYAHPGYWAPFLMISNWR